jgi:hypothetical protein
MEPRLGMGLIFPRVDQSLFPWAVHSVIASSVSKAPIIYIPQC